jgi:hypothetical protein
VRLKTFAVVVLLALLPLPSAWGGVVINEIYYNAPDELDDVQWVELFNPGDKPVDLGGWTLDRGKLFTFPAGTTIEAGGFVVVALNPDSFARQYDAIAIGPMKRRLKHGGERLELHDAGDQPVDAVRYKNAAPWPVSADGYSASLERICPAAPGDVADNWAASPLPDTSRPAGTPGKPNESYSASPPPVVTVPDAPAVVAPDRPLTVQADVKGASRVGEVTLLYRTLRAAGEDEEVAVPMAKAADGRYAAEIPGQAEGAVLRYRVKAVAEGGATRYYPDPNDLRPTLSTFVHGPWHPAPISLGLLFLGGSDRGAAAGQARQRFRGFGGPGRFGGGGDEHARAPRGPSAFVYVNSKTGNTQVFDYINAPTRSGHPGFKVLFHKDRPLNQMSAVSLVFEGIERQLMAEALAYDVYRRAGNAAPLTEFVRLWVNGELQGYHLAVERPNKGFLRRNKVDDHGNLYKILWYGNGVVGAHAKKTHVSEGHDDVVALVDLLGKTRNDPEAQWAAIQKYFDVDQAATHFAVNMVLSHWDGFFNNYYAYHDTKRDKWQMYPWDHDKSWGIVDGGGNRPVVNVPLTFGMNEAGGGRRGGFGGFGGFGGGGPFGGNAEWWRPPGYFSGPLLANPHFRKVFLQRVRSILDDVYTEQIYVPLIDDLVRQLGEDAALRGTMDGGSAAAGKRELVRSGEFFKTHLRGRREFLLKQKELTAVGKEQ